MAEARRYARLPLAAGLTGALVLLLLAFVLHLEAQGFLSRPMLDLLGRRMLASEGELSTAGIVASYPSLPNSLAIIFPNAFPGGDHIQLLTLNVVIGTGLALAWYVSFRRAGHTALRSIGITAALVFNPLFLRGLVEGPGWMFLLWGAWWLFIAMLELRRGYRLNDVILTAIALATMMLARTMGAVIALASLPFVIAVIPPAQVLGSLRGLLLTILFPALFAVASLLYVNWAFTDSPTHFLSFVFRDSPDYLFSSARGEVNRILATLLALACAGPLALAFVVRTRGMWGMRLGAVAAIATLCGAVLIGGALNLLPGSALMGSLALPLVAVVARRWAGVAGGTRSLWVLLALGIAGGALAVAVDRSPDGTRFAAAVIGNSAPAADEEDLRLAKAIGRIGGVMFDAETAPSVVALRGSAAGIVSAQNALFKLSGYSNRLTANAVVVRNPQSLSGGDLVTRNYPRLYADGFPGYSRSFDGANWRVYHRDKESR
jgi:hypothetical protein